MKTFYTSFILFLIVTIILFGALTSKAQTGNIFPSTGSAGIGTTAPNASALLEMKSTAKGILIPRMTAVQRNAIKSPATGLMIFQTNNVPGFYYFNGTVWSPITVKDTTLANRTLSNLAVTSINTNLIPQTDNKSSLGATGKRWKTVSLYGLNFSNNTNQTTAFVPYIAGAGISITGNKITATSGGGGANTSLSNLTSPTAVNRDLIPGANATNDLGAFNAGWRNAYLTGTLFSGSMQASSTGTISALTATAANGYGIYATSSTNTAIYGTSSTVGVYGNGNNEGVYGNSQDGFGLYGKSATGYGIVGDGGNIGISGIGNNQGVSGLSTSGDGVYGISTSGDGVHGYSDHVGVYGDGGPQNENSSDMHAGVYGTGGYYGVYGSSIGWAGYFSGSVYSSGSFVGSDRTLKQNIRDFSSAMNIINKLHPQQYEFRQDGNYKLMNLPAGSHYGLIAQDVEKVLPYLIKETKFEAAAVTPRKAGDKNIQKDSSKSAVINFKALNYTELIPVIIKGMQELSKENDSLKAYNAGLEERLSKLEALMNAPSTSENRQPNANISSASLDQNIPNPFKGSTTIGYTLPETYNSAQIIIRNSNGNTLKSISVSGKGKGSLNINASTISSGAYSYSLLIDGMLIDTKQMVLMK